MPRLLPRLVIVSCSGSNMGNVLGIANGNVDHDTTVDPCKCCPHIKLNIAIYYIQYNHPTRLLRLRLQAVLLLSLVTSWRPSTHYPSGHHVLSIQKMDKQHWVLL